MLRLSLLGVVGAAALSVSAQQSAYGQCKWTCSQLLQTLILHVKISLGGGTGWTGATTCASGYTCQYNNDCTFYI
jgi:hypothetical protein